MELSSLVREALREDVGTGDVTTEACVESNQVGQAEIRAKADLVVCGHAAATETFAQVGATYQAIVPDGERVPSGAVVARISGPLRALLTGERLALNFLMRLALPVSWDQFWAAGRHAVR